MARERVDAWMDLPPFDRLGGVLLSRGEPSSDPPPPADDVPIHMIVKGTQVWLRIGAGREAVQFKFRYIRSSKAWQLYLRDGSKWITDGPPGPSRGALLEKILRYLGLTPSTLEDRMPAG